MISVTPQEFVGAPPTRSPGLTREADTTSRVSPRRNSMSAEAAPRRRRRSPEVRMTCPQEPDEERSASSQRIPFILIESAPSRRASRPSRTSFVSRRGLFHNPGVSTRAGPHGILVSGCPDWYRHFNANHKANQSEPRLHAAMNWSDPGALTDRMVDDARVRSGG